MSKRRTHSPEFMVRVAMEAISGPKTIQEIAVDHHAIHPIQVCQLKEQGRYRPRRYRSAGQEGSFAKRTYSLNGCGGQPST